MKAIPSRKSFSSIFGIENNCRPMRFVAAAEVGVTAPAARTAAEYARNIRLSMDQPRTASPCNGLHSKSVYMSRRLRASDRSASMWDKRRSAYGRAGAVFLDKDNRFRFKVCRVNHYIGGAARLGSRAGCRDSS